MTTHDLGRRRDLIKGLLAVALSFCSVPARAESAGRVLFGFQPTESTDLLVVAVVRKLRDHYQPDFSARLVTLPGNSGSLAREAVANAAPDGATVLASASASMTLLPLVNPSTASVIGALTPVAGIGSFCHAVIVGPAVPATVKTMTDYLSWARANPQWAMYGIPGRGTASHVIGAEIARLGDVSLKAVSYKGTLPLLQDVANGAMPAALTLRPSDKDLIDYPSVRVLAVSSAERWPGAPDTPTLVELRLAEAPVLSSLGLFVSNRVPGARIAELRAAIESVMRDPEMRPAMLAAGVEPMPTVGDYPAEIARERAAWERRIALIGFSADR